MENRQPYLAMAMDLSFSSSTLTNFGLPIAFALAFLYVMLRPRRHRRRTRLRTAVRILLARHIWLHRSTLLDFQYFVVGMFGFSLLFGYALVSGLAIRHVTYEGLTSLLGPREAPPSLPFYAKAFIVFLLYMAYEFAYWIDHYLSHKIPFLWEFHKVHHSATVLTPFSSWRVHPVDSIVYMNIQAIVLGASSGLAYYLVGDANSLNLSGIVAILLAGYMALWGHAQHSQFWISFTGLAGRIFLSPAHHQIHHSSNPIHFDKNFGASLAIWDWVFRTLHIPHRENEHIVYGTKGDGHLKRFVPSVLYPFHFAATRLVAMLSKFGSFPTASKAIAPRSVAHSPASVASETLPAVAGK